MPKLILNNSLFFFPANTAKYPQIQIELLFDDRIADLVVERFDVALRGGRLPDSGMVARKLFSFNVAPYAANSYLKRFGEPKTVDDLAHHNCLHFRFVSNNTLLEWELESSENETRAISTSGNLILNDPGAVVTMCAAGLGVALLADFLVVAAPEHAQLKRLLPEYARPPLHIYACYPSRKHAPLKTRVFVDYLVGALKTMRLK